MKFKKFASVKLRPAFVLSLFFFLIAILAQLSASPVTDTLEILKLEHKGWSRNTEEINCTTHLVLGFFEWTHDGVTREIYQSPSGTWISPQIIETSEEAGSASACRSIQHPSFIKEV